MTLKSSDRLAYILLILASLFWAGNFVIGKFASIYEIPAFSLNFYRWFFVWIILFPFTYKEIYKNKKYIIDISGGLEDSCGNKNIDKIDKFLLEVNKL